MALTVLFYQPEAEPDLPRDEIEAALGAELGLELGHEQVPGYQPWRWRDPRTGAICDGDLGQPPLEEDTLHPETSYDGWRAVGLAVHIPVPVAHWHCVEAANLIQRLMDRLPGCVVLDTEDTGAEEARGPGDLDRVRLLASWEQLHAAQTAGRRNCWRMDRHASLAVWRYRREQAQGRAAHPELTWPGALAVLDGDLPRSATFWVSPEQDLALPPVELVVVHRGDETGVITANQLRAAVSGGTTLEYGAATRIAATPAVRELFASTELTPVERYRALDDQEWTD